MKITLIAVGRLKEKYLKDGIAEYAKRLSRFCELEIIEVDDEQAAESIGQARELQVMKKEAERILTRIRPGSVTVALDLQGKAMDSEAFTEKLESFFVSGSSHITFIIGGSLGLDAKLRESAALRLSLSPLTFPHQLTRLILLEQLYRAFKIINGETYHK